MNADMADIVTDLDARFPGKGVLSANELMAYMDICRQVATNLMHRLFYKRKGD